MLTLSALVEGVNSLWCGFEAVTHCCLTGSGSDLEDRLISVLSLLGLE